MQARRSCSAVLGALGITSWLAQAAWCFTPGPWTVDTSQCALDIPLPLQPHARFGCPAPLDDTAGPDPIRWSPWTHRPQCANATGSRAGRKYCVFTNARHGHGGLTLLTTPQVASDSVHLVSEPLVPDVVAAEAAASRRTASGGAEDPSPPAYAVVDIPGKGKGVVATRAIARYETILVDYASLLVALELPSSMTAAQGYRLLHAAADQLADPDRVYGLGMSDPQAPDPVENVLKTNAFQMVFSGVEHMVLFPLLSRFNHACQPNAYQRFVPRSLAASVAAMRDIEPGEELTINYLPVGQTYVERETALRRWHFRCTCALCSADPESVAASDTRRLQLRSNHQRIVEAYRSGDAETAIALTRETLRLVEQEGLSHQLLAEQYENLGRLHWAAGRREEAAEWARRSLAVLAEQGFVRAEPRHLQTMLARFAEDARAWGYGDGLERGV